MFRSLLGALAFSSLLGTASAPGQQLSPAPLEGKVRVPQRFDSPPGLVRGEAWQPDPRRPSRWVQNESPLANKVIDFGE